MGIIWLSGDFRITSRMLFDFEVTCPALRGIRDFKGGSSVTRRVFLVNSLNPCECIPLREVCGQQDWYACH